MGNVIRVIVVYLGESKGERRNGEHDLAGSDDHVLRQLPQHVQAVGRGDDHIQVLLQKLSRMSIFFFKSKQKKNF